MGLFDLFKRAEPVRDPDEAPRSPRAVFISNRTGQPVILYDDFCTASAALSHPVLSRAIRTIALAIQQVDFYAEPDDVPEAEVKTQVADINDLLKSPNPDYTKSMLLFWLGLSLSVYHQAGFKVGMGTRSPNAIYPLDARYLRTLANSRGRIEQYEYGLDSKKQTFPARLRNGPVQSAGWASSIIVPTLSGDLTDPSNTVQPLRALGGPSKILSILMQRTLASVAGATNSKVIITTQSTLTAQQEKDIDKYIQEHDALGEMSGETMFLNDVELQVHTIPNDLSDVHSKMPADDMTRMIFGAYGIPIALAGLGAADGAKFASNYSESRAAFYTDTIAPGYLTPIAGGLTKALCPAGVRISYDLDKIAAIQQQRIEAMAKLKDVDFLTADEKRELFGYSAGGKQ